MDEGNHGVDTLRSRHRHQPAEPHVFDLALTLNPD